MDVHAAFQSSLDQQADAASSNAEPVAAVGGSASDDLYASLMAKESNVLELVRRVDETNREDALKKADRLAPLASSFLAGITGFLARLVHYSSRGATQEALGLITSPDGLIYTGTLIVALSIILMFV